MDYKAYFSDNHFEYVDAVYPSTDGIIVFYTSGIRKCRYNDGIFEQEKTRVRWDENGLPHFTNYWVNLNIEYIDDGWDTAKELQ